MAQAWKNTRRCLRCKTVYSIKVYSVCPNCYSYGRNDAAGVVALAMECIPS